MLKFTGCVGVLGHMIYAYNEGQRWLSLLVWLLDAAGSTGDRLSGSLLTISLLGEILIGPTFNASNNSRPLQRCVWYMHGQSARTCVYVLSCTDIV